MVFIFARPTDWMPIPVMICWSEKLRSSFRHIGAEVDFFKPSRMMEELRMRETKFVMMKARRVCGLC